MLKLRKMLMIAIIDALATQVYIELFAASGFRISTSVILLPIFLYFYEDIHPMVQALFIMTVGLALRSTFGYLGTGDFGSSLMLEAPTMLFDFSYGLIFYLFYSRSENKTLSLWYAVILFNDFFSNLLEMGLRSNELGPVLNSVAPLLLIASIRATLAIIIVLLLKYYKFLLKREEHEERYRSLLLLSSELNSELYMMSNNMAHVEEVMTKAFELYEQFDEDHPDQKRTALDIAKEVHEIKKQYSHVMKGLEAITGEKPAFNTMALKDLLNVLEHCFRLTLSESIAVRFVVKQHSDFIVSRHFMLMSILRNLIGNAIESVELKGGGLVELIVSGQKDDYHFSVRDTGFGIKEKDLPHIFRPGFSTKFNEATGAINRGVGLTLIKELVENHYHGRIEVTSEWEAGATFTVIIPKLELEGQQ